TSWSNVGWTSLNKLVFDPYDSNMLYGVSIWGNKIYQISNNGTTTLEIPGKWTLRDIAFGSAHDTIYAFGHLGFYQYTQGRIVKITENGSWTISEKNVDSLIAHPNIPEVLYAAGDEGIIKSITDGKTWGYVNNGLPVTNISCASGSVGTGSSGFIIDPANPARFYLAYLHFGIYRGTDTNSSPLPPVAHSHLNNAKIADPTPLITGSSSPGSIVFMYDGSTLSGTATPDSNGLFSLISGTLTIGVHALKLIASNRFGTSSPAWLHVTIMPGVAPTIDTPLPGATNKVTITVSGVAEDGSTVVLYDRLTPVATVTAASGLYSGTITLSDGTYQLHVTSTNDSGIIASSEIVEVIVDTVAPPPPWIQEPCQRWGRLPTTLWGLLPINNNKPVIKGITIATGMVTIYDNNMPLGTITVDATGGFELKVTTPMPNGKHELRAQVTNNANNISQLSYPFVIVIDTKPVINYPRGGKTNNGTFTVSGCAPPDETVEIWIDGIKVADVVVNSTGTFTYEITTSLNNGSHSIKAKNTGGDSNEVKIIVAILPFDPINVVVEQGWRGEQHIDENNKIRGIRNRPMNISVPVKGNPDEVKITIEATGETITLTDLDGDGIFTGSVTLKQTTAIKITIIDENGSSIINNLMKVELIDPAGLVYNKITNERIENATVTCYWWDEGNNKWAIWDAWNFENQINPQITPFSSEFDYSFLTPKGKYYIYVKADGYYDYKSPDLEVIDVPVFHDVYMEPIGVLTSIKVFPQSAVLGFGGTCSFTAIGYDQYDRMMPNVECDWQVATGSVSHQVNSTTTVFTATDTAYSCIITAATGSIASGTASITVRAPVTVRLNPSTTFAQKDNVFTLNIAVENVVSLISAKVILAFDAAKIRVSTISVGNFFKQDDAVSLQQPMVRNELGTIEINGARIVDSGDMGVSGDGILFSVLFTAIASNPCGTVSITEVLLKDASMASIFPQKTIPAVISSRLLGDFGSKDNNNNMVDIPDGKLDFSDLIMFTNYWNIQDLQGDIASTRTTGTAPYFVYQPDSAVDIEDLTIFAAVWYWYYTQGKQGVCSLLTPQPLPVVKLTSVSTQDDEIVVEVIAENVYDLLSAHLVLEFDANRLEVINATSPYNLFRKKDDVLHGMIDMSITGLGRLITSGTITRITFKKLLPDTKCPTIRLTTTDLRIYKNSRIDRITPLLKSYIANDLRKVCCYPNPFVKGRGNNEITFDNLTPNAQVKIYTIAGELVYDSGMQDTSAKGYKLTWDVKNQLDEDIASGIYLYLVTNPEGDTVTGKIGIIR
ncbi:MAG: Ig-like domain-containing protein, partial [bacterium]|nr:Ig-like domain-containing protein [bacterium]